MGYVENPAAAATLPRLQAIPARSNLLHAMSAHAAIELEALSKRYGPTVGIEDLHLKVRQGEVFGFLGPNGSGKTTTIRCLVGLLTPTAGRARVLGLDPLADHRDLAPRIGYLPGELRLYGELTGAQHLRLLGDLQGAPTPRRDELCERLDLSARDLDRPVAGWSRGMKQKLGLVQALQHDPEVAILDEPTEGLDPLVQETFFALLDEAKDAGRTVFLSSHVLAEVQRACGRVAIVRGGRLATVQAVEALRDARARRVRLTFADGVDRDRVPVAAHWSPAWSERTLRLLVEGSEVVPALRRLLELPVTDLAVEEAGLDEAFLAFYRQAEAEAGTAGGRSA
jgi:ABC-2 type transport system ATP-binding protein